jgi:ribonuclease G
MNPPSAITTALPEFPAPQLPPGCPVQTQDNTHHERSIATSSADTASRTIPHSMTELDQSSAHHRSLPVDAAQLKGRRRERSKQRPLLQKILAVFQKEKTSYRELIINSEPLEKRVALLVDGRLEKFEIERDSDDRMVGGIFKGRSRTSIRASRPRSSTSAIPRTRSCTTGTCSRPPPTPPSRSSASTRRRTPPPPRRAHGQGHPQPLSAGQRDRHPGHQGPDRHQGPAHHHQSLHPRPLPDPHAVLRRLRHLPQDRGHPRAQAAQAADQRTHHSRGHGRHRPHRGRRQKARYFVRDLHLLLKKWEEIQAKMKIRPGPRRASTRSRTRRAHRARLPHRRSRPRADRQPDPTTSAPPTSSARSPNAPLQDRVLQGQHPDLRTLQHRAPDRADLPAQGHRCPAAARSSSTRPRPSSPSTSTPAPTRTAAATRRNVIYAVNLEAAVEIARQIRLRNLGGLIIMRLHRHEGAPPPQRGLRKDGRAACRRTKPRTTSSPSRSSASCR